METPGKCFNLGPFFSQFSLTNYSELDGFPIFVFHYIPAHNTVFLHYLPPKQSIKELVKNATRSSDLRFTAF